MADVHVVPQASRWGLEVDGDIRSTHDTQEQAVNEGRGLAEQEQGELVIHGEDGEIARRTRTGTTHATRPVRNLVGRGAVLRFVRLTG